ncbi:Lrp/AsnC family transcriptional regulator, partial [Noviherbaspirillum denitrificans]|uniref:Lrp/AsnC family transcriptional regulator n=1 Tax=Noviherbaspirillum denitrificans TaxID=1968433 RepID=UPI00113002BD
MKPTDDIDRAIIVATQQGLPLVARPYHAIAEQVGIKPEEVMARMNAMLDRGLIRRIGVVPNHYAIGYVANGMS